LDADTILGKDALTNLVRISNKRLIGTFRVRFNKNTFSSNLHSAIKNIFPLFRIHNASGVIFCHKDIFNKMGGYDEKIVKGENGDFIKRAKRYGKYYYSKNYSITSSRRFEELGYLRTALFWLKEYLVGNKDYPVIR
jgi:hypothetical protein